ncbi:MAG TPA: prenyltransferase/squalene oxidase repeat-containing protein [Gemmataceae bacterium]
MKRVLLGGLCLLAVVLPASAQSDAHKKATLAYLQKLQSDDGGFRANAAAKESDLPATTSAFRALRYFGGAPRDKDACAAFVRKCFDKERGGFATRPGGKAAYRPTAVGIMAVVDLKMPIEPYAEAVIKYLDANSKTFEEVRLTAASFEALGKPAPSAEAWLKQIAKMRHTDGTYGEGGGAARDTGGAVCAVLRLGGTVEQRENVLKALNAGQRKDGGFGQAGVEGSDLATTYRVMRAFHMLRTQPQGAGRLRDFIARCRNDDGGYGVAPGQPSNVSGCYYAGIILHWLDEK